MPSIESNLYGRRRSDGHTPDRRKNFQEKLAEALMLELPNASAATTAESRILENGVIARELSVEDADLFSLLAEYGINPSQIEKTTDGFYELPVNGHFSDRRLPEGYGYKGGAARALLLRALGIDDTYQPRDVDVVRIADTPPFPEADDWVSQEFMPDDYARGDGVEAISSTYDYFATRDLTINEVLATDTTIIATKSCLLDSARHIIRLSRHERARIRNGGPSDKMMAKLLRAYAEAVYRYDDAAFEAHDGWAYEEYFISPFWLALQLDRAFDIGTEVAERYAQELIRRRQLPNDIIDALDAAQYLSKLLEKRPFYYRHAPVEQFEREHRMVHGAPYAHLPTRQGLGKGYRPSK